VSSSSLAAANYYQFKLANWFQIYGPVFDIYVVYECCVPRNFACLPAAKARPWLYGCSKPIRCDPQRPSLPWHAANNVIGFQFAANCCNSHDNGATAQRAKSNRETYLDYRRIKFMYVLFWLGNFTLARGLGPAGPFPLLLPPPASPRPP